MECLANSVRVCGRYFVEVLSNGQLKVHGTSDGRFLIELELFVAQGPDLDPERLRGGGRPSFEENSAFPKQIRI